MIADLSHGERLVWKRPASSWKIEWISDQSLLLPVLNKIHLQMIHPFFSLLHHHSGRNDKNGSQFNKDGSFL